MTNFSFKMLKIIRSLRSSKCWLYKKQTLVVLGLLVLFSTGNTFLGVNLVSKLKISSLSWYFVPRLIQIRRIPCWFSLFLFSTGNTFLGKFDSKNPNCQFELKFCTRLISIWRIMSKTYGVHFFCFIPGKPFLEKSGQKNQNCQLKQKFDTKRLIRICGVQWWC